MIKHSWMPADPPEFDLVAHKMAHSLNHPPEHGQSPRTPVGRGLWTRVSLACERFCGAQCRSEGPVHPVGAPAPDRQGPRHACDQLDAAHHGPDRRAPPRPVGLELEVVGLVESDYLLIIHVMPYEFRRRTR